MKCKINNNLAGLPIIIAKGTLYPLEESTDLAIYLESAIACSDYFQVSLAILKGADLQDMDGVPPLKYAMECGDQRIIDLLISAGAKLPKYVVLEKIRETDPERFLRELDNDSYNRIYKRGRM